MFKNWSTRISIILLGTCAASFSVLSSLPTSASNTTVSDIDITVPISCNIITTLDSPHTAVINPGQAVENIGTTTFNVFCNDNAGYAIYAIGYSNEEYGNTNMIATVGGSLSPSNNIATGLTTSGTSSWSMKLNAVTGTYAPTIVTGFEAYHVVPDTYTKVAYLTSSTDYNTGSSLQSTYKGYISSSQPSGTYNGKVKYTIVHPNNADTPTFPIACNSGNICYNPNASGVTDSMGDQSITSSATTSNLWASNFQRPGYGFVGWSDKFDWTVNANDVNGNGTGDNAGYHIYGPNATIEFTAGQYTDDNPGLSLYAVWVKSAGNLQGWTGCSGLSVGQVTALTDTRDDNTYAVAKLADGKCWMIENLRLADQSLTGTTTVLAMANTNNPANDGNNNVTIVNVNSSGNIVSPATNHLSMSINPMTTSWCYDNTTACLDKSMLFSGYTVNPVSQITNNNWYSSGLFSYGNYYNWYSVTAGKGTSSFGTNNNSVDGDLCPAGWRLPKGGDKTRIELDDNNDFWNLVVDGLNSGTLPANYNNNTKPSYSGSTEAGPLYKKLMRFPNNYIKAGYVVADLWSITGRGTTGAYWTSTASGANATYRLVLSNSAIIPGSNDVDSYRYNGYTVRCIFSS